MTKIISILILCYFATTTLFGQDIDSSKVTQAQIKDSIPILFVGNYDGLVFTIKYNSQKINSRNILIDMTFDNPTDSVKTIYWQLFNDKSHVPVNFLYTLTDSTGKKLFDHYCSLYQMESWILKKMQNVYMKYDIKPNKSYNRTVKLPYYFNNKGTYTLQLFYGDMFTTYLTSNIINFEIN